MKAHANPSLMMKTVLKLKENLPIYHRIESENVQHVETSVATNRRHFEHCSTSRFQVKHFDL